MISELKVGPYTAQDGAQISQRASKDSSTVVMDAHARYQEAVYRGNVFSASNQAGVATPAGLNATVTGFAIYNPIASGKNLVLLDVDTALTAAIVTGSSGAIFLAAGVGPNVVAPTIGTALTVYNNLVNPATSSVAKVMTNGTFVGTPVAFKTIGFTQAIGTLAADIAIGQVHYELAGEVIIPPGAWVAVAATTALTLQTSMTWEEISI